MNPKELRIGNWVLNDGNLFQIEHGYEIGDAIHQYEPTPLTEEWLLKFGFENGNLEMSNNDLWDKHWIGDFEIEKYENRFTLSLTPFYTDIYFVHHLQNLYFALTGNELCVV